MKGERSGYRGSDSEFIVMNARTSEIIPDLLILDPMSDSRIVDLIVECGMTAWANSLKRRWTDIQEGEKDDNTTCDTR